MTINKACAPLSLDLYVDVANRLTLAQSAKPAMHCPRGPLEARKPMTKSKIGVGIVGSGLVAQAIHLPVLATRTDIFEVRRIFDIDPGDERARRMPLRGERLDRLPRHPR